MSLTDAWLQPVLRLLLANGSSYHASYIWFHLVGPCVLQALRDEEAARAGSDADGANEVPDEFLDPLLSTLMTVRRQAACLLALLD